MKVLVSGSHGLVGSALTVALPAQDHAARPLPRSDLREGPNPASLEGIDAVFHLAGEPIVGRWTESKKRAIRASRVEGTTRLVNALGDMKRPPQTFICASAIGYYGDRGTEVLTEDSVPGHNFLSEVCRAWEGACMPLTSAGVRVVNLRFG